MKAACLTALVAATVGTLAFAQDTGDVAAGKKAFAKCRSCHSVVTEDGTAIERGGRNGPNLYGVTGRNAGSVPGFRYLDSIKEAGTAGLVWDAQSFAAYVRNPTAFLREWLGDGSARSAMTFKLKNGAEDIYAYLASIGPRQ